MLHTMMHDSHGTFSSTSTSSISQPLPYIHALLPNETWNAIFQSLETSDLASVARVSHRWGAIAERVLYASVSICEDFSSSFQLPRKTSACCEGLARRPYLVEVVKSFHVRWTIDYSVIYTLNWESVLDDLANTLRSLAFLESLDLCLNLTRYWIFHSWDLLRHCHFPSLRHFSLTGMGYTPVAWFLNTTPSIRHLSLVDYRQNLALVPRALPLLCSFRGSPTSAASVVPGRPVQCIELVGQGEVEHEWINTARDAMSKMAMASLPVRYLDLSSMSVTPMLLSDISKHLSDLEVLKVRFALRHTLHFANTGIGILEGLTHILRAFQRLSTLDFSSTSVGTIGPNNAAHELSLCKSWTNVCPSLEKVMFPSKNEWLITENEQWVRPVSLSAVA